jgi:DNA-binding transcriptional LysR family regulator
VQEILVVFLVREEDLLDVRQLKYFVEVCNSGSFAQAAETCHISPQGISTAIIRLERELSCKLFKRTPRGVVPTANAEYLLPHAREIVSRVEKCETYFARNTKADRLLPVFFAAGTIQEFAGKAIAAFKKQYPHIHLSIYEETDLACDAAVEQEDVELALTLGPVDENKFNSVLLFSTMHAIIVHESHALAQRQYITVEDLRDVPVAIINKETKTNPNFRAACKAAGFEPRIAAVVGDILLVYHFAEDNTGVGISTMALAKRLARPHVRAIPFVEPEMQWNIYLIKNKNATLSSEARAFEQTLISFTANAKK